MERGMEQGMKRGMERGMEQGMEQGIEQGIERGLELGLKQARIEKVKVNRLHKILLENNQLEELKKALEDDEYQKRLMEEYNIIS